MQILALVDCNSFFVSCEKIFNPKLEGKPVIVLSRNDGCIISRSKEAKALGLEFQPYFQVKDFCLKNEVEVFSANFHLYADISIRVMSILREMSPKVEIYSIDEAFISLSHIPHTRFVEYCQDIRNRILREVGLSVSIGISSTKALSKIAQSIAKKNSDGIYDLSDEQQFTKILSITKVEDIWGIGNKSARILKDLNIHNALEFRDADSAIIRKYLSVTGQRLQYELRGESCLEIEQVEDDKKNIRMSRTFGKAISTIEDLEYIASQFASNLALKLRTQKQVSEGLYLYIRSAIHNNDNKFSADFVEYFDSSTNDTAKITFFAKKALSKIFKKGVLYKKICVILLNLSSEEKKQLSFGEATNNKRKNLFLAIDLMNKKIAQSIQNSRGSDNKKGIFFLSEGVRQYSNSNCKFKSQEYTTKWSELLKVK